MVGFKKKIVSAEQVAAVERAAAASPLTGDPSIKALGTSATAFQASDSAHLGSSQDHGFQGGFEVGKVYDIPLGRLKSNPFNPRVVYTSACVDEMALSLSENGQRISVTGYVGDEGEVVLIEGETRLRGARAAGLPTLRVEVRPRPASDRELYEEARAANVERRNQTPLDDAIKWRELLSKNIYPTQSALAKALKVGEDQVSRTLSLAGLPHRIIHACAVSPELLSLKMLNAIREYWEIKGDENAMELIFEAARDGWGYRDVAARRKTASMEPIRRPRAEREVLSYKGAKGEIKSFEEDGRIELSIKGLDATTSQELMSKLIALFPKPS